MSQEKMLIKATKTRLETTYSFSAEAGTRFNDKEQAMSAIVNAIQHWIGKKLPFSLPPEASKHDSYIVDEGGQRVEVVSAKDQGIWAARLSHPDFGLENIPAVAGRHWTIDTSIKYGSNLPCFSVRVACSTPCDSTASLKYVRPGIVKILASEVGLKQVRQISENPWILHDDTELDDLENLLLSPNRQIPVILITQPDKRKWTYTQRAPTYIIDGLYLAKHAIGYAHIVQIPFTIGYAWTQRVGTNWAAFDGSVRLYMPKLNFQEDTQRKHPVIYKQQIRDFAYEDQTGERSFSKWLTDRLHSHGGRRYTSWAEALFVPDARVIVADYRAQQIARLTNIDDIKLRYEAQIEALRLKLAEAEQDATQWSDASIEDKRTAERVDQENKLLRRQNDILRQSLAAKTGAESDQEIEIPNIYADMPEWVDDHLAGRLVLHPRAIRNLKDATYEDISLVYKTLLLLANEYRNMRLGRIEKTVYEQKCDSLELRDSKSISEERAGEQDQTYFVKYPIDSKQNRFLEKHLRKGSTKDDRHCLGVYFFWDDDTEQVIVGWLPSHLRNRLT